MQKVYNKLVRDNIPHIIKASGQTAVTSILPESEYKERLKAKLLEEANEFIEDENIEELADVLEVVYALAAVMGYSREELEAVRAAKAAKNGGFAERILLERVEGI